MDGKRIFCKLTVTVWELLFVGFCCCRSETKFVQTLLQPADNELSFLITRYWYATKKVTAKMNPFVNKSRKDCTNIRNNTARERNTVGISLRTMAATTTTKATTTTNSILQYNRRSVRSHCKTGLSVCFQSILSCFGSRNHRDTGSVKCPHLRESSSLSCTVLRTMCWEKKERIGKKSFFSCLVVGMVHFLTKWSSAVWKEMARWKIKTKCVLGKWSLSVFQPFMSRVVGCTGPWCVCVWQTIEITCNEITVVVGYCPWHWHPQIFSCLGALQI